MERDTASRGAQDEREPDGHISRRSFLDRSGKTLAGLSAAAALEASAPQFVWGQQTGAAAGGRLAPDRFDYLPITDRPAIKWPNNARVAFWVAPNIEWWEYTPQNRPTEPDVPDYGYKDYGNRVGFWRMAEVLDHHKIRACVCLAGAVLDHCPEIRDAMVARDWDYMAHGIYNTRPISNYSIEQERAYWRDQIASIKKHTGKQLKGRLGASGGNSVNTPDLMAEFGLLYHADWTVDDQPYPMKVKNGKLIHVPYSFQTSDSRANRHKRDAAYLSQVIKDQFDVFYEEGAESGKVMCVALHPNLIGRPSQAKYLDEALSYVRKHDGVWITTGDEIAEYYMKNYYDKVVAHIEQAKQKGLA